MRLVLLDPVVDGENELRLPVWILPNPSCHGADLGIVAGRRWRKSCGHE